MKDKAEGRGTSDTRKAAQHAQTGDILTELDDWELSEGGLPEGSTLSSSKSLLDGPPGMRPTRGSTRGPTPAKVVWATPRPQNNEGPKTPGAR